MLQTKQGMSYLLNDQLSQGISCLEQSLVTYALLEQESSTTESRDTKLKLADAYTLNEQYKLSNALLEELLVETSLDFNNRVLLLFKLSDNCDKLLDYDQRIKYLKNAHDIILDSLRNH